MDAIDRSIVNELQGGFPVCERPYAAVAARLGIDERQLLERLQRLLAEGVLSRFGPMYHAERLGGALTLAALRVPEADYERVAALVNAHPEVAHNYAREHALNMWFVLATETPERIAAVITAIEQETDLKVYNMPKLEEFYVGLRFDADALSRPFGPPSPASGRGEVESSPFSPLPLAGDDYRDVGGRATQDAVAEG